MEQRAERIMMIQSEISLQNNLRRVGQNQRVITDSRQGEFYVARSQYDSPEVDQEILIAATTKRLIKGRFYDVQITSAEDFDLYATLC